LYFYVQPGRADRDAGAVFLSSGAREPGTQDYGGRDYTCKDPVGYVWSFGTYDPMKA
jgi:uncharacterized glyoxalase superfamily protein PhnB